METVTVSRRVDAAPDAVEDAMSDVEAFVRAAGFDEVAVDGDDVRVANQVGVKRIELHLAVVDRGDAALAYEQRDGVFESMETTYEVVALDGGAESEVVARTEFALDVPVVGDVLDSTIIRRQRRRELEAQLDWLDATAD